MTVIAWDGKTLSADKQATACDMRITVTKIKKLKNGAVAAWTGTHEQGIALAKWYEDGADSDKYPEFQKTDDWTCLVIAENTTDVRVYHKLPIEQKVEDKFMSWGCGRDFAMAAMEMGASAEMAVLIAGKFNIECGNGVDSFLIGDS